MHPKYLLLGNLLLVLALLGSRSGVLGLLLGSFLDDSDLGGHLVHLPLRAEVSSKLLHSQDMRTYNSTDPALGESPSTLLRVVASSLEKLHDAALIRSEASDFTDDTTNQLGALAQFLFYITGMKEK